MTTSRPVSMWGAGLALLALLPLVVACRPAETAQSATVTSSAASMNDKQSSPVATPANQQPGVKPPAADAVLYFIYGKDGDGATTYEVDFGSTVGYWYGHEFDLDSKRYFTGFGYKTAERDETGEVIDGTEQDQVSISQATFLLETKSGKTAWSRLESDGFVGAFGANDNPLTVDSARKAESFTTQDGRFLLAIPSKDLADATELFGYALFVFDPKERAKLRNGHWAYLGNIVTGSDNSAACADGEVMPCVSSSGALSFKAGSAEMPDITVSHTGTSIAAPGKVRKLTAADAEIYRYDSEQGVYSVVEQKN